MKKGLTLLLAGALVSSMGCGGGVTPDPLAEAQARPVVQHYAALVYDNYTDTLTQARALKTAVDAFVAKPSDAGLQAAKAAWITARASYGQTESFRFYGGPIDDDETGPEGLINSWPIDEAYIDGVRDNTSAGIINATSEYPTLSQELLVSLNEQGGEDNIATGYHAIEFLLWGQDFSATGPGNRPYTDFVDAGTEANASRRRQYLTMVTDLLVTNLTTVQQAWTPGQDNYGKTFSALAPKQALLKMLTGMGSLSGGELGHERMSVPYDTKDQEDEHSCFSDNTLADLHANALSIQNVYLGTYNGTSGKGIADLVEAVNPALNKKMKDQLQASLDAIQAIPAPFDQAILGADSSPGRQKLKAAIDAVTAQTSTIVEVATALGVQINLE